MVSILQNKFGVRSSSDLIKIVKFRRKEGKRREEGIRKRRRKKEEPLRSEIHPIRKGNIS